MDANKPRQTLADRFATVVSPALIMVMVASLVFFLIEVLYIGDFAARLRWILAWFVFGAVLVSRISMQVDKNTADRAWIYGVLLGGATWIGMMSFVEYPAELAFAWAINIGFIALVGWVGYSVLDVLATDYLISLPKVSVAWTQSVIPISCAMFILAELLNLPSTLRAARGLESAAASNLAEHLH